MAQPRFSPQEQTVQQQRKISQNAENAARMAQSKGEFKSTGWGEFVFEDAVTFSSPFLYRPSVSYGSSLYDDDSEAQLRTTRLPRCSGVVYKWNIVNGLYYGAWCLVTVEDRSPNIAPTDPDPDPNYVIVHDFSFQGIATKRIMSPTNGTIEGAK